MGRFWAPGGLWRIGFKPFSRIQAARAAATADPNNPTMTRRQQTEEEKHAGDGPRGRHHDGRRWVSATRQKDAKAFADRVVGAACAGHIVKGPIRPDVAPQEAIQLMNECATND